MARYELDRLGWLQFEELCQSLLKACFSPAIQSWGGSGDHGRDAYYEGRLPIPDASHDRCKRNFVFQAKFVSNANAVGANPDSALKKAIEAEKKRITGSPDCYVLMTNCPTSSTLRDEVTNSVKERLPSADIVVWGVKDVCDLLDAKPILRTAFPQILSLRDLEFVVLDAIRKPHQERARAFIDRAREVARAFVPTSAYWGTLDLLRQHHMAVISGPPEMGKTTTALVIGLTYAAADWQCFECRSPGDFFTLLDRDAPQLFVADDAFGTTEYQPRLAEEWASDLDSILRTLDRRHLFIWTSRTAPLERALSKMNLQQRAAKFPKPAQVTVDAADLKQKDKALMLYRHARMGDLTESSKGIVKRHAGTIVAHEHFTPRRIERFVQHWLSSDLGVRPVLDAELALAIKQEIQTPTDGMKKSFHALPDGHKRYLVAMLDTGNAPQATIAEAYARIDHGEHGMSPAELSRELDGHFIAVAADTTRWMHPSWRDIVIEYLSQAQPERRRFLASCSIPGVELALSTAGGVAGERVRPLLVSTEDWTVLGDRILKLAREVKSENLCELVVTISEALSRELGSDSEDLLLGWARSLLLETRDRWRERGLIPVGELTDFALLTERVAPLAPLPELDRTWAAHLARAQREISSPEFYTDLSKVRAWLALVEFAQNNEPRFLRQLGFPSEYTSLAQKALDLFDEYVGELEYQSFDGVEGIKAEIDQIETFEEVARALATSFPSERPRIPGLERKVTTAKNGLEAALDSMGEDSRPHPRSFVSPDDERISLERLFEDL